MEKIFIKNYRSLSHKNLLVRKAPFFLLYSKSRSEIFFQMNFLALFGNMLIGLFLDSSLRANLKTRYDLYIGSKTPIIIMVGKFDAEIVMEKNLTNKEFLIDLVKEFLIRKII